MLTLEIEFHNLLYARFSRSSEPPLPPRVVTISTKSSTESSVNMSRGSQMETLDWPGAARIHIPVNAPYRETKSHSNIEITKTEPVVHAETLRSENGGLSDKHSSKSSNSSFYSAVSEKEGHATPGDLGTNSDENSKALSQKLQRISRRLGLDGYVFIGGKWEVVAQAPKPATVETVVDDDDKHVFGDKRTSSEVLQPNVQEYDEAPDHSSQDYLPATERSTNDVVMQWLEDLDGGDKHQSIRTGTLNSKKRVHFDNAHAPSNDVHHGRPCCSNSSTAANVGLTDSKVSHCYHGCKAYNH